jgi:NAD(P)-dependent dehydrogenase (short-subunit alcohol dehydrogenase family)
LFQQSGYATFVTAFQRGTKMAAKDRVWFITGASSGFGKALAEAVLSRGERVVLAARRVDRLIDIAQPYGDRALALPLDVTDGEQRARAVDASVRHFGRIDVLANIAGRGSVGAVEEFAPEQLRDQLEVNFFAAAELTRLILPLMRKQRSGHILNLTSVGGVVSLGGFGAYCAGKFALEGWSDALRDEVAPFGIRVTIVEPGNFRTEFAGGVNLRPENRLEAYRQVIGPVEDFLYGQSGRQAGDPDKAAALMIEAVDSPNPPGRLMMGKDAFDLYDRLIAARQKEYDEWRSRGEATAFDGAKALPIHFQRGQAEQHP